MSFVNSSASPAAGRELDTNHNQPSGKTPPEGVVVCDAVGAHHFEICNDKTASSSSANNSITTDGSFATTTQHNRSIANSNGSVLLCAHPANVSITSSAISLHSSPVPPSAVAAVTASETTIATAIMEGSPNHNGEEMAQRHRLKQQQESIVAILNASPLHVSAIHGEGNERINTVSRPRPTPLFAAAGVSGGGDCAAENPLNLSPSGKSSALATVLAVSHNQNCIEMVESNNTSVTLASPVSMTTTTTSFIHHVPMIPPPPAAPPVDFDIIVAAADEYDATKNVLPPLTMADVMDCFRLYFGSSVTTFPFYAARLGAVGFVFVISAAIGINLSTQNSLHRTRYNLVLAEMASRIRNEKRKSLHASAPTSSKINNKEAAVIANAANSTVVKQEDQRLACDSCLANATRLESIRTFTSTVTCGVDPHRDHKEMVASHAAVCMDDKGPSTDQKNTKKINKKSKKSGSAAVAIAEDLADMMPYFMKLSTLVKVSNQLWPDHWLKRAITVCTFVSQFFTCCSFSLLFARNLAPVVGLAGSEKGESISVYIAAAAIATLTLATSPKTKTILAYCNNLFIFGGAGLLLLASISHEASAEEQAMGVQMLPKSVSQFAIYAPSVIAYLSVQLLTIDVETLLAARCSKTVHKSAAADNNNTTENAGNAMPRTIVSRPAPATPTFTPSANAALNLVFEQQAAQAGAAGHNETPTPSCAVSGATSPSLSRVGSLQSFAASPVTLMPPQQFGQHITKFGTFPPASFASAAPVLRADVMSATLSEILLVKRYYRRALYLGAASSTLVLLFVAEFIMLCFKDNTNAIIALSLPTSTLRTLILMSLCVGLYACGALNVGPICDLLDNISSKMTASSTIPSIARRIGLRTVLFSTVVAFLYLIPFFDLVAGLSGAVCTPAFAFFIPSACELQSEIIKLTAVGNEHQRTLFASASAAQRVWIAFSSMAFKARLTLIISVTLGSLIFTFSTAMVIQETLRRHHSGGH